MKIFALINIMLSLLAIYLTNISIGLNLTCIKLSRRGDISIESFNRFIPLCSNLHNAVIYLLILLLFMSLIIYREKKCNRFIALSAVAFSIISFIYSFFIASLFS